MNNVVVFGASGNLGFVLVPALQDAGWKVVAVDRGQIDARVASTEQITALLQKEEATMAINLIAMNDVDGAEGAGKELATQLNETFATTVAHATTALNIPLMHVSTDYVFDGAAAPYAENATPAPQSHYARTKAAGEHAVQQANTRAYIVRTSRLYGPIPPSAAAKPSFATNVVKWAINAGPKGLKLVDEEYGCPTYTPDLAAAMVAIANDQQTYQPGVYHLVNEGDGVTWHSFAQEIFQTLNIAPKAEAVTAATFGTRPAMRPSNSTLLNTKGPKLPPRTEALKKMFFGLQLELTDFPGLVLVTPKRFADDRGSFGESFNTARWKAFGLPTDIVQVNTAVSKKGVWRGLHFQRAPYAQGKTVRCLNGAVHDVVVDIRPESPTYGQHFAAELTADSGRWMVVPPGFAHGYLSLTDNNMFEYYIAGAPWHKPSEGGLRYNDPSLNITLPDIGTDILAKDVDLAWPLWTDR
jgi:dTDP-4-dehydrorhamnose 3,5-epimerase